MNKALLQRIFDLGVRGVLAQGGPSRGSDGEGCMYRAPDGRKCAIGHAMTDEGYADATATATAGVTSIEGQVAGNFRVIEALADSLDVEEEELEGLAQALRQFQMCHDGAGYDDYAFLINFRDLVIDFAKRYGLNTAGLNL